ncbi:endonuclease CviAII [Acanthocystis turfacea Chlorella virus Canal-1]|nr:endonuclease CviAII [Acanthocystis turfacea Chlorella virus Canal-1]
MQKIMNPVTGRLVKADGVVGKKIRTEKLHNDNVVSKVVTKRIFNKILDGERRRDNKESLKISKKVSKSIFDKIRQNEMKKNEKNSKALSKKIVRDIFKKITKEENSHGACRVDNKQQGVLLTEDLGKIFEKSICMLYNTPYVGKYKYGNEKPTLLKERIKKLVDFYPAIVHTAIGGGVHDFSTLNSSSYLSAKTSKKKDGKVAPQTIGQPTKKKFLEYFHLSPNSSDADIKRFIQRDIVRILDEYFKHTFTDDIIYYNEHRNLAVLVKTKEMVKFNPALIEFGCSRQGKTWNESTILFYDNKRIGEFQIHTSRSCIKFRWFFENVLELFPSHFDIAVL